jgi:hypothetical protein
MRKPLQVVHINRATIAEDVAAKEFWINVLAPKWEQMARERGEKLLSDLTGKAEEAEKGGRRSRAPGTSKP